MTDHADDSGRASPAERRLLEAFRRLPPGARRSLVRHAEAEVARHAAPPSAQGADARAQHETVVHAIRRLTRAYPGLDRARLLGAISRCLAEHMLDAREAGEVIAELETLFAREAALHT